MYLMNHPFSVGSTSHIPGREGEGSGRRRGEGEGRGGGGGRGRRGGGGGGEREKGEGEGRERGEEEGGGEVEGEGGGEGRGGEGRGGEGRGGEGRGGEGGEGRGGEGEGKGKGRGREGREERYKKHMGGKSALGLTFSSQEHDKPSERFPLHKKIRGSILECSDNYSDLPLIRMYPPPVFKPLYLSMRLYYCPV